ncbi:MULTISPECIES: Ig-like domain-containing protein [unclassified Bradyrhizobium]|uniref:Ig-like domain-containing protein n=1 Tax=unclassified Bradyrhizobium TaxID=2631580 RepID=UPI002FF03741
MASLSDIVTQNTLNMSEGFPQGVPHSWNWYKGWNDDGLHTPPAGFTAVEGWGQVYHQEGQPLTNPNANVEVANSKTYVRIKQTGEWVLVQDQSKLPITGGHFVTDFTNNGGYAMNVSPLSGGGASFDAPPNGYNDHFWFQSRGTYQAGTIDAVYVQMDMRTTDANANLVAMVGADWWRDANAPYLQDHSNNPGIGGTNWVELSTQWKTLGYYSTTTAEFQGNLPPPLRGAVNTPPVTTNPDTTAPAAPKIAAFTPDTGAVGDKITTASVLTLSGTAEAGSTVKLFDGSTQIGTAKANASGTWSVATSNLATGSHNFTAKATDTAGNTSSASSLLSVKVDGAGAPSSPSSPTPPTQTPAPSGENLLVNGSFEASSLAAGRWAGFSSIPGWTAISGGTIELWNNLNNVKATNGSNFGELDYQGARDGLYQAVKTTAGQSYDLSFDARSRSDSGLSTNTIEVLWNDKVVATVPPGSNWQTHHFSVTGTGGQDRLTFREAAGQGADGHGALYDNVSLVSKPSAVQQSAISLQPMNLVNQFAATSFADTGAGLSGGLNRTDLSATLAQTLAKAS